MYSGLAQPDVQYSDFEGQLIVRPKDREKLQIGLTQNQVQFKPSLREHIISKSMLKAAPSHSGALSYGHEFEKAYDVSGASYSEGMKQDVTFLNDSPTKINKARVAIPSGQACFSNSPRVEHERPSSPEIQRMDDMSERACIPSADISPEIVSFPITSIWPNRLSFIPLSSLKQHLQDITRGTHMSNCAVLIGCRVQIFPRELLLYLQFLITCPLLVWE